MITCEGIYRDLIIQRLTGEISTESASDLGIHLSDCEQCASDLIELSFPMSALRALAGSDLNRLRYRAHSFPAADLGALRKTRRIPRRLLALAAAAVIFIVGIALGHFSSGPATSALGPIAPRTVQLISGAGPTMTGVAMLQAEGWGTKATFQLSRVPAHLTLALWLEDATGKHISAGSVDTAKGGTLRITTASALRTSQVVAAGYSVIT